MSRFKDCEMVTDTPISSFVSLRQENFLTSTFGQRCDSFHIRAVYLQGYLSDREVYSKPLKEFYNGQLCVYMCM